jgi:hypothetical protein
MTSGICYDGKLTGSDESGVLYGHKKGCNCRMCSISSESDKKPLLQEKKINIDNIAD